MELTHRTNTQDVLQRNSNNDNIHSISKNTEKSLHKHRKKSLDFHT